MSLLFCLFTLFRASVSALQIAFINISYEKYRKTGELLDFQRGQIVGARLAGASVTKMATLLGVSRAAVSRVMAVYTNHRKTSSAERNSSRKPKVSERNRSRLKRIVSENHRNTAAMVTAELNIHLEDLVPTKTVIRGLHESNIHSTAVIAKPTVTENNITSRKRWCNYDETWKSDGCKYVIWSDESSFTLFPTSGRVHVWRTPKEA